MFTGETQKFYLKVNPNGQNQCNKDIKRNSDLRTGREMKKMSIIGG